MKKAASQNATSAVEETSTHTQDTQTNESNVAKKIDASHIQVKLGPLWGFTPQVYVPVFYLLGVLLILFFIFFAPGLSTSRRDVNILTDVPGASVFFDGLYQGSTPFHGTIPSGAGELSVEKPGYETNTLTVDDANSQVFALGFGWFAQNYEFALESVDAREYVQSELLDWALWSRVGGFGLRDRSKLVYDPELPGAAPQEVLVSDRGGEYFMPPIASRLFTYSQENNSIDDDEILRQLAFYSNDEYLFDRLTEQMGIPNLNWGNIGRVLNLLMEQEAFTDAAYPAYFLMENADIARFNMQHGDYLTSHSSKYWFDDNPRALWGYPTQPENGQLLEETSEGVIYKYPSADSVANTIQNDFIKEPQVQEEVASYQMRLEAFEEQPPRSMGTFNIGGISFRRFSSSKVLITDNYLGPYDALYYLEDPIQLAVSVPEFAMADLPVTQSLWDRFTAANPNYQDKLPEAKYHPHPQIFGTYAGQRDQVVEVSFLEGELLVDWLNETYANSLGEWRIALQGEDHFQAALAYSQLGNDSIRGLQDEVYEWTSHFYAPASLLLNPWLGELQGPVQGFERVIRGGTDPQQRAAMPENWQTKNIGLRLVLVKD